MERKEAYTLLMELISLNLAVPSVATLKKNKARFDLELKADFDMQALKKFTAENGLILRFDEQSGSCIISKPVSCLLDNP